MTEIIELKGFNYSHSNRDNFLFSEDEFYVMDNHRLALWCWLQKNNLSQKYYFLHIDYHNDTNEGGLDEICNILPKDLYQNSLNDFRDFKTLSCIDSKKEYFISWDNYISIFNRFHGHCISNYFFYVMEKGSECEEISPYYLHLGKKTFFDFVENSDVQKTQKWIVNIDLDYFFLNADIEPFKSKMKEIISDLAQKILFLEKMNKIEVVTIAISPNLTKSNNGWNQSIAYLKLFEEELDRNFSKYILKTIKG